MLKNSLGLEAEIFHSLSFHAEGIPLLISSSLLRARNMGQIDLGRLKKYRGRWQVEIAEVKSSQMGHEQMLRGQKIRLRGSQHFLAGIFGHPTKLLYFTKMNP